MTLTAVATKIQTLRSAIASSALYGVIVQHGGTYLCGVTEGSDDFPYDGTSYWYASTDLGATWSLVGSAEGMFGQYSGFPTNIAQGVACSPSSRASDNGVAIIRSTNGGSGWSTVYDATPAAVPNGRYPWIYGIQSFERTKAIAWGELDGNKTNPAYLYAISTNAGATWTPVATFDSGDYDDIANAMGVAAGGTWFIQYTKFGGINRTSNFAKTTNGGTSWTTLGALPGGAGTPPNFANAICCFDADNIAIAGQVGSSPLSASPGVWYSHDGGSSITRLNSSDIVNFPSGSFNVAAQEVKRLTRDSAILAIDRQDGGAGSPWRITLDRGETYPIEVSLASGSWQTYQIPTGKIAVTPTGRILAPLWQSNDYSTADLSIFAIDLYC